MEIKGFTYRRVKNDVCDAPDLADLLQMGRLPEAWIAPPAVELLSSSVTGPSWSSFGPPSSRGSCILAKQRLHLPVKELFGPRGRAELAAAPLDRAYQARLNAYLRIVDTLGTEIVMADGWIAARLTKDAGYRASAGNSEGDYPETSNNTALSGATHRTRSMSYLLKRRK